MTDLRGHTTSKRLSLGPPSLDPALLYTSQTPPSPPLQFIPSRPGWGVGMMTPGTQVIRASGLVLPSPCAPTHSCQAPSPLYFAASGSRDIMSHGNGRKAEGESFPGRFSVAKEKQRTEERKEYSVKAGLVLHPSVLSSTDHTQSTLQFTSIFVASFHWILRMTL